jgi:hypothetical protein
MNNSEKYMIIVSMMTFSNEYHYTLLTIVIIMNHFGMIPLINHT